MNCEAAEWKLTLELYKNYNVAVLCSAADHAEKYADRRSANILMTILVQFDRDLRGLSIDWGEFVEKKINVLIADVPMVYIRKYAIEFGWFCEANHILFVDSRNYDLIHLYKEERVLEAGYASRNLEELKKCIEQHEVISFDIFDTLLCRKILDPEDVYEMMAIKSKLLPRDFADIRKKTEKELDDPNIYEIYAAIKKKCGWTSRQQESMLTLELEIEDRLLTVRTSMKEAFQYAVKLGKTVYLLSDMYIPAEILKSWLEKRGIRGYSQIWVSCDKKVTKYSGMYQQVKENISAKSFLHIGDNWSVDGVCAQACGMDTYLIKGTAELFRNSCYSDIIKKGRSINDKLVLGMMAERLFNDPFALHGKEGCLEIGSLLDVGYLFWGPVTAAFMDWLVIKIKRSQCHKVIFPSRDGFLPERLYRCYRKRFSRAHLPEGIYILISRNACMLADIKDDEDIAEMLKSCPYSTLDAIMQKRFLVEKTEFVEKGDMAVEMEVLRNKPTIQKKSQEMCKAYRKYLEQNGLERHGKYVFFDLISSGTCQLHLENILKCEIQGCYLCREDTDNRKKRELPIQTYLDGRKRKEARGAIRRKYLMTEFVFSSESPSVKYIDTEGRVVFETEKRGEGDIRMMQALQEGILDFYEAYLDLGCPHRRISKELADTLFGQIEKPEIRIVQDGFYRMRIYDDWSQVYLNCLG